MWPLTIYLCPACGRSVDALDFDRTTCAGAEYDGSEHADVMMVAVRVFREEDVRALWDASRQSSEHGHHPRDDARLRGALAAFPAPEEWRAGS